jgi:hypothetical protein
LRTRHVRTIAPLCMGERHCVVAAQRAVG